MGRSQIEWTDRVWNLFHGCAPVSPGCANCYAARVTARFSGPGQMLEGLARFKGEPGRRLAVWSGAGTFDLAAAGAPLRWRRPSRVFVNSMSDAFFEPFTFDQIAIMYAVMAATPTQTYQLLTKRPQRAAQFHEWLDRMRVRSRDETIGQALLRAANTALAGRARNVEGRFVVEDAGWWSYKARDAVAKAEWPLPNVWLGVSTENQEMADERIPWLLETPAAVRFVSAEPLLEGLDIETYLDPAGAPCGESNNTLDWVIAGCESGPGARPAEVRWFRELRDQCARHRVPYFLKQAGNHSEPGGVGTYVDGVGPMAPIDIGPGSKVKGGSGGVIGAPYLDGCQHLEFPEVVRG